MSFRTIVRNLIQLTWRLCNAQKISPRSSFEMTYLYFVRYLKPLRDGNEFYGIHCRRLKPTDKKTSNKALVQKAAGCIFQLKI